MTPILAFFGLVGGIVLVYASDRKAFLRIGEEIRVLTQGGGQIDLTKYNSTGAIYPIMQAVHDLCGRTPSPPRRTTPCSGARWRPGPSSTGC
jgi:hypothetical protein